MRTGLFASVLTAWAALLFAPGCDTHCIEETDVLWPPSAAEYRLVLTNRSTSIVELVVDGQSQGVFCSGVDGLAVGNYPRQDCSEITAHFLDNPADVKLDDCTDDPPGACEGNNADGRVCYDTIKVERVEAVLN